MARLDVFRARPADGAYLLEVQADYLYRLETRVVVPLVEAEAGVIASDVMPHFVVEDRRVVMLTPTLFVVPRSSLRRPVTSLLDSHDIVVRALDTLFLGF